MKSQQTFIKHANIQAYNYLLEYDTLESIATKADISIQHLIRLLKIWKETGLVTQDKSRKYHWTDKGMTVRAKLRFVEDLDAYM